MERFLHDWGINEVKNRSPQTETLFFFETSRIKPGGGAREARHLAISVSCLVSSALLPHYLTKGTFPN